MTVTRKSFTGLDEGGEPVERRIEANTPPLERFKVGDHVAHINAGDGEVTGVGNGLVQVKFLDFTGIYDANWFATHPGWLFHRGTRPPPKSE